MVLKFVNIAIWHPERKSLVNKKYVEYKCFKSIKKSKHKI